MLLATITLVVLLLGLIFLRNSVAASFQKFTFLISQNRRLGLYIYTIIFLPGVIIHEMSHFLTASALGVKTGEITIFPTFDSTAQKQRLGSVQIAKTDIFRSSLIGLSPLIVGSILLVFFLQSEFSTLFSNAFNFGNMFEFLQDSLSSIIIEPKKVILFYLIFAISNTMFVSSSDRRSWPALIFVLVTILIFSFWLGITDSILLKLKAPFLSAFSALNSAFFLSLFIDILFILPLVIVNYSLSSLKD